MRNYDLEWARTHKGLSQKEASDLLGVTTRTFSRWETGAVEMPRRKWQRFLEITQIEQNELPKRLKYDSEGYPVGFDQTPYHTDDTERDYILECRALFAIEGEEYAERARERARLRELKYYAEDSEQFKEAMALYDKNIYAYDLAGVPLD